MQSMIKGWAQRNKFGVYVRHHIIKWCKFMIAFLVKWSKAIINYRHHLVSTDGNRIIHRRVFGLLVFQGPLSFLNIPYSFEAFSRWCADCMQAILMNFYLLSSASLNIRTMFRCKLWRQSFFECIGPRFAGAKISLCSE